MTKHHKNPIKAIRQCCLDCCGGSSKEVEMCVSDCALREFRFGKNPYRTPRVLTEEQKEVARERLEVARQAKLKE